MRATASLAGLLVGGPHPVRVAGVINVSPESFYAGSVARDDAALAERARAQVNEGADLIDVGAMSTAPYLQTSIDEAEELRRLTRAIGVLVQTVPVPISADTQRAAVAAAALAAGARIINDTSGLRRDPGMAEVAAGAEGMILMANEPGPTDEDPVGLCTRLLQDSMERAERAGVTLGRVVLDPGIGFFRRARVAWDAFDLEILRRLREFEALERPLLIGVSRKSFIGKLTGQTDAGKRLWGSLAATAVAVANGAAVVRTHDVAATRDVVRVAERLR